MKAIGIQWPATTLALLAGTLLLGATQTNLNLGDPAPKLQPGKWLQGGPITGFAKDKAYLVEFWATWCGPCRESIPHLNEIYQKYKDRGLVVIGQNCWDEGDAAALVKKMGDKMTYPVALDDKTKVEKGIMAETWMKAAGQDGIPTAFLVDKKGMLAWLGHPMELKDEVIEAVLAGTYDIRKAVLEAEQQKQKQLKLQGIAVDIDHAIHAKDWGLAAAKVNEASALLPPEQRDYLDRIRFDIEVAKEDFPAAYKLAAKLSETHRENVVLQNELAWQIATDPRIKDRDLALAEKIAKRANEAAQGKEPAVLDTLGRVAYLQGHQEEAVAYVQKALDLADDSQKSGLQRTLEEFKKSPAPKAN